MHNNHGLAMHNVYRVECFDRDGNLKWVEENPNLTVNAGLNDVLSQYFKGSTYTAAHYVGLIDNAAFSAIAAGDTMASHAGWAESTAYSNANRPTLTLGSVASQSVDNSASKAAFNVNATATIKGAFVTTNNTKGGSTGTLYGAAAFGSTRSVENGDTLNVQVTLTSASA
jgi:hypothetical protein